MKNLKYGLIAMAVLMICSNVNGQRYFELTNKADSLYKIKDYQNAAQYFEKAFEIQDRIIPRIKISNHYDAACCWALAGDQKRAFKNLHLAVDNG